MAKKLRTVLKSAGIYNAKLEPQILLAERLQKMLDDSDLEPRDALKALSQLQSAYTALGLTYDTNVNRITPEDTAPAKLDEFLKGL